MVDTISKPWTTKIKFSRETVLGEGNSFVYQGTYKSEKVAVKRIVLERSLTNEFTLHNNIKHDNVLKLIAVEHDNDFRYIVLELCCGSLFDVIEKTYNGPPLPPDNEVIFQIANGLYYIHSLNLVHLDIKPENILISMNGHQIKLGDFGSCNETFEGIYITSEPICGTPSWMAPELCLTSRNKSLIITTMADVFSFGCVCFVFLTRENGGVHPFGNRKDREMVQFNIREGIQVNWKELKSLPFANVIHPMIENKPEKRGSLTQVMKNLHQIPTRLPSIPPIMDKIPSHQETENKKQMLAHHPSDKEEPNLFSESQGTIFNDDEKGNHIKDPNDLNELKTMNPQFSGGANYGFSCNDRKEGDVDKNDSINNGKSDNNSSKSWTTKYYFKSTGEPKEIGKDPIKEVKPDPSGLSSTSATNGLNKREQQKVVSDDDYEEQEENEQQNKQFSIPEVEKTRSHESQYRPSV